MATQQQAAEYLDLNQSTISALIASGILSTAGRSGIDLDQARVEYIRHLRDVAAGRSGDESLTGERIRLTKAQAHKVEMQNAIRAREVLEWENCVKLFCDQAARVRTHLMALPSSIAPAAHRAKTVAETCAVIEAGITESLEALTSEPSDVQAALTNSAPQPNEDNDDEIENTEEQPAEAEPARNGRGARSGPNKRRRAGAA